MDNDSNTSNCVDWNRKNINIMQGVFGGLGVIACTVALVFAIVSRFYKDIVQRLILYKLIAVLVLSLCQYLFLRFDDSNIYKVSAELITIFAYLLNLNLTFWLTVVLYLCIVHLKKLKSFTKLEPIAILSSFLPLVGAVIIPFTSYDNCTTIWEIKFSEQGTDKFNDISAISYTITLLVFIIVSMLVIIIFIVTVRRSRLDFQRKNENQVHSLLVTNNKWKILSKQLLPLVVYPIVNTVLAMIFLPLKVVYYNGSTVKGIYFSSLISSSGLITGIIVIIHLCIVKCKKKQRERKISKQNDRLVPFCVVPNNHNDVFTRETVASTNARTTYQYTRTSSFTMSVVF
ncbi:PREDICTED: uncharacterized protein LOC109583434 [Amphimedon queenslandica]|uniref:G-protein coupled receptors family 2 profile 2 domain-containing protein n=1 Tax=Amphimedon queenslandica TaxID=400682 RepID=A0AAN0JBF1_AMPQE|nr:PREDICTED: uncharacterized protein LOC109583434 [Amphimedon queenslandica]|eukprot:XP_019854340.1 PREDICTED: uncharacterized protein LOC109583434 [Amphimedon queenslandica]